MKRVAIIGTGISGMVAARLLHRDHHLTVFEASDRVGGHTHTVPVTMDGVTHPVDTGFIVFNRRTYPGFCAMLELLGVEAQPSNMSFSVRDDDADLEYLGGHLGGLFAQRRNLIRPRFLRMITEIVRFYREAHTLLAADTEDGDGALGPWLARHGYSRFFVEEHLIPMAAAIWSAPAKAVAAFPARFFMRFLANHGMIDLRNRPQWLTVSGGSQAYLEKLIAPFAERIRCNAGVSRLRREGSGVRVIHAQGEDVFDEVVVAAHADQALAMLDRPHSDERAVLACFPYQSNAAILHSDHRLLPKRRQAWAAWNYHRAHGPRQAPVTLTYNLNILQSHKSSAPLLVTLNPRQPIAAERVIKRIPYAHPLYSLAASRAQQRHQEISGRDRIHYCGAYWGYGFHEDGLQSALRVGRAFGVEHLS